MAEKNADGIYNVAAGSHTGIEFILKSLLEIASIDVEIRVDEKKLRPVDIKAFCGSNVKLSCLGWKPKTSLQEGLRKTFDYWLRRCQEEHESGNCP